MAISDTIQKIHKLSFDIKSPDELKWLRDIYNATVTRITAAEVAKQKLILGQKVYFLSKNGYKLVGELRKMNRKSYSIYIAETNQTWRVSPHLVKAA